MATIADVAKRAGCSVSTVSYAFSGKRPIAGGTRMRIMQSARELGYMPADSGNTQARERLTHVVAVSAPINEDTAYGNWSPFVFSVVKNLRRHGYDALLLTGDTVGEELIFLADRGEIDGILLLDMVVEDDRAIAAQIAGIPTVSIGCARTGEALTAVDLDFEHMGRLAVETMAAAGHRHVLFIGADSKAYEQGVNFLMRSRSAMMKRAAQLGVRITLRTIGNGDMTEMREMARTIAESDPRITGVLGQCGHIALSRLQRACDLYGLQIPHDVSMLELGSFGNGAESDPPIDEIPLQPYQICRHAVDSLVNMIAGRPCQPGKGQVRLLPVSYLRRGSVGRPACFDAHRNDAVGMVGGA